MELNSSMDRLPNNGPLAEIMTGEINSAIGRKALEFGSGRCSLAEELRNKLEYLACTDRSNESLQDLQPLAEKSDIMLIPDRELGEDCYFGRFHLVYTLFGFHDLPHLVDEIMRLRRLILKGGKLVIIDSDENQFSAECIKQLKRCGFTAIRQEYFSFEGEPVFLLAAEK